MRATPMADPAGQGAPSCTSYEVRVLARPVLDAQGIRHGEDDGVEEVPWQRVRWAVAAEVGEPQGVRTIVFDLWVTDAHGDHRVLRLDAEPGEDASVLARMIERRIPGSPKIPSVRCLAVDGIPARWYPDLGSFEEDAAAELEAFPER